MDGWASRFQKIWLQMGIEPMPAITRDIHTGFKIAEVLQRRTGLRPIRPLCLRSLSVKKSMLTYHVNRHVDLYILLGTCWQTSNIFVAWLSIDILSAARETWKECENFVKSPAWFLNMIILEQTNWSSLTYNAIAISAYLGNEKLQEFKMRRSIGFILLMT